MPCAHAAITRPSAPCSSRLMRQAYAPRVRGARNTALIALAGALVGVLALLPQAHVDPWSWIVAPAVLAVGAVAQARALFSEGGPLRT